jgi:hypothetical protein
VYSHVPAAVLPALTGSANWLRTGLASPPKGQPGLFYFERRWFLCWPTRRNERSTTGCFRHLLSFHFKLGGVPAQVPGLAIVRRAQRRLRRTVFDCYLDVGENAVDRTLVCRSEKFANRFNVRIVRGLLG